MATSAETARATAFRTKYAKAVAQGVTFISPLFAKAFHGRRLGPGAKMSAETFKVQKGIEWGCGGGDGTDDFKWQINKELPTAEKNRGELRTRDFAQTAPLDTASIKFYNIEKTAGISDGDQDRTKKDPNQLDNLWKRRSINAEQAVWTGWRQEMWNTSETDQNAGISHIVDPDNVAAGSYAGIAMATTNAYWTPAMLDYGTPTIAANAFEILSQLKVKLTRSSEPAGGGMQLEPDFSCFNPTSWACLMTYVGSKYSKSDTGALVSPNMFAKGFQNVWINGIDCFYDTYFAGTTVAASQFLQSAAASEFLMGHSDKIWIRTTATKAQGLVRGEVLRKPVVISGMVGVFRTGLFAIQFVSPVFFGYGYT